jgi:hypothetical protein
MKTQCSAITNMLVTKLDQHFANSKLMNALGIVYPQFWMQLDVDCVFPHFACNHRKTLLWNKGGETFNSVS